MISPFSFLLFVIHWLSKINVKIGGIFDLISYIHVWYYK